MKTHGDYKARIDALMGIKSAVPKEKVDPELAKLKRELRDAKVATNKYKSLYAAKMEKK
jgi:hypothetical protein